MAITMQKATYARDDAGKKALKSNIQSIFKEYRRQLTAVEHYTSLDQDRRNLWSGTDSDQFWRTFQEKINKVKTSITKCEQTVLDAIDKDYNNFRNMQNNNKSKFR